MTSRPNTSVGAALLAGGATLCGIAMLGTFAGWGLSTSTVAAGSQVSATPTLAASPTSTMQPAQTAAGFLAELAQAQRTGDTSFLNGHLNPAVLARYGAAQCSAHLKTLRDPTLAFSVKAIQSPGDYAWKSDGKTTVVPDTFAIEVNYTRNGQTSAQVVHVSKSNGMFTWFTDCGSPLAR